jgi:hypothetical protein
MKMRPSRATTSAVLAVTLLTSALLAGTGMLAGSPATAAPVKVDARHAQAKDALAKVVATFSDKRTARTAPRTTTLPRTDVTLLLRDLRISLPSLTKAERKTASTYLARPSAGGVGCSAGFGVGVVQTVHFCVHYFTNPLLAGQALDDVGTLQQAQSTATTFEDVYRREVSGASNSLGFRAPISDGDQFLDVYLLNLGDDHIYGYCDTDDPTPTSSAYCAVDNNFSKAEFGPNSVPINSLRVTAAHEFFHAVQFAYDADDDSWFLEGTAVWMEDIVYPSINDYLQYLPLSQLRKPRQSADYAGGLERYGTVVFWKYLSERFKDDNIIRQIWNAAAVSAGNRNGINAVGAVLRARGYVFTTEFARYGVWNTLIPGSYADRSRWPAPGAWATGTLTKKHRDTGKLAVRLNHLAHAPLVLRAGAGIPTRSKLRVVVDGPNKTHGTQATVQIRFRSGKVTTYLLPLNSSGYASRLYGFNPRYVKSAIVIATNASTGYNNQPFLVRVKLVF